MCVCVCVLIFSYIYLLTLCAVSTHMCVGHKATFRSWCSSHVGPSIKHNHGAWWQVPLAGEPSLWPHLLSETQNLTVTWNSQMLWGLACVLFASAGITGTFHPTQLFPEHSESHSGPPVSTAALHRLSPSPWHRLLITGSLWERPCHWSPLLHKGENF